MAMSARSYAHGVSATPLLDDTIGDALDKAAERWPDREAVVVRDQGVRLTFAELRHQVDRLAAGFIALGLRPGDRVGIWSPNNIAWVLTQYATAKAGLILVCINPAYRVLELEYALNKVGCKALVTADRFKTSDYLGMLRTLAPELECCAPGSLRAERLPHLTTVINLADTPAAGCFAFEAVRRLGGTAEHARLMELADLVQPDDPVNIQFTSGTTGAPKAATLTHRGLVNNAFSLGANMAITEHDRYCIPLPLYHTAGMVCGSLLGVLRGAAAIYVGEAFDPLATLETLQVERCTAFEAVPTMFVAILHHPRFADYDLTALRKGLTGGAPCPPDLMRQVMQRMHMRDLVIVYGMTECSPLITQTLPSDPPECRVSTVGRALPHVEVKIVDADGRTVPRGVQGEVCARGYLVMQGYWDGEAQTADAIDRARWMHTGDLGTMNRDGFVAITGRNKDMVIRGGENIYPREVEEFLFRHSAVADVHGFGVPDVHYGEELCVWIKLKDGCAATEDDIRGFCRGQITHFKIPRYVRFVEDFPMTVTGKVQKYVMREIMTRELAATAAG